MTNFRHIVVYILLLPLLGLHNCANYMQEIGGEISVSSDGPGTGATFTLSFPKKSASGEKFKRSGTRRELIDAE